MNVRVFSNNTSFVSRQRLQLTSLGDGVYTLSLLGNQVSTDSLKLNIDASVLDAEVAQVFKDNKMYRGILEGYSDYNATISSSGVRRVIRNFDHITIDDRISILTDASVESVVASYTSTGITGKVLYELDMNTGKLDAFLSVSNDGIVPLVNAQFQVVTSEEVPQPQFFYAEEVTNARAVPASKETSAGTVYTVPGRYTVAPKSQSKLKFGTFVLDANIEYVIRTPRGTSNAVLEIRWNSPMDLPPGTVYVTDNGELVATTSVPALGKGQEHSLSVVRVASVYAKGNVSRSDSRAENGPRTASVSLTGTVYNTLSETVDVYLSYSVGEAKVSTNTEFVREGDLILFSMTLGPNTSKQYNYQFTLTY